MKSEQYRAVVVILSMSESQPMGVTSLVQPQYHLVLPQDRTDRRLTPNQKIPAETTEPGLTECDGLGIFLGVFHVRRFDFDGNGGIFVTIYYSGS